MKDLSKKEYLETLSRCEKYNNWAKQYTQKNGWVVIPKDAQSPVIFTNDDRSAIEEYEWKQEPPVKYFLYVDEKNRRATTWTGQILATVQFGAAYRSNFGDTRQPIWLKGTNGKKYYGTYFKSSGDYARIKMLN